MSGGWNTIESDAGVFTELIETLGVKGLQFDELLSIDTDSLLSIGSEIYGLVFLFKYGEYAYTARSSDSEISEEEQENEGIFFAKQKIQNACATQAVLNILMNIPESKDFHLGEGLSDFKSFVSLFDPDIKGEAISNSDLIRQTHNSFSSPTTFVDESVTKPPSDKDDGLYHFIAYTKSPTKNEVIELDGLLNTPTRHGTFNTYEEFVQRLSEALQKRISSFPASEIRFNVMALIKDKRITYAEQGDTEALEIENEKRAKWKLDNELRRFDYFQLIYQLLKLRTSRLSDEEWQKRLEAAKQKTLSLQNSSRSRE